MKWCSIPLAEEMIHCADVSRGTEMVLEYLRERITKRNRSHTGHGFCCHQLAMPQALLDPQPTSLEIDVPPLLSEQFA
jgi:hypothetical protein